MLVNPESISNSIDDLHASPESLEATDQHPFNAVTKSLPQQVTFGHGQGAKQNGHRAFVPETEWHPSSPDAVLVREVTDNGNLAGGLTQARTESGQLVPNAPFPRTNGRLRSISPAVRRTKEGGLTAIPEQTAEHANGSHQAVAVTSLESPRSNPKAATAIQETEVIEPHDLLFGLEDQQYRARYGWTAFYALKQRQALRDAGLLSQ